MKRLVFILMITSTLLSACKQTSKNVFTGKEGEVSLIVVDPGHFHAALLQKTAYPQINNEVYVYAPEGDEVKEYLAKIEGFNTRAESPTNWKENVYLGDDFMSKMLQQKPGNVVVLAGNNQKKTDYIFQSIEAGLNVLSDKPMAINVGNFELLKKAFEVANQKGVLLYDVMTERYEITTLLQKEFSRLPEVFGALQKGSAEQPAIVKESVHHFFKDVAGSKLKRPAWFFDVEQQGEGIVDVTTHLVDLVQWECFPEQIIDTKNIDVYSSKRWPTVLSKEQFSTATTLSEYPAYLQKYLKADSLFVYSNGVFNYTINGVHAQIGVIWNFQAPEGTGDTHYSIMRGELCNLVIRQAQEQNYKPTLYVEPVSGDKKAFLPQLQKGLATLQQQYPGIDLKETANGWEVLIPQSYHVGHEAHFGQVAEKYLGFLKDGKLPAWEVPNMIAKYYTTTKALEVALAGK